MTSSNVALFLVAVLLLGTAVNSQSVYQQTYGQGVYSQYPKGPLLVVPPSLCLDHTILEYYFKSSLFIFLDLKWFKLICLGVSNMLWWPFYLHVKCPLIMKNIHVLMGYNCISINLYISLKRTDIYKKNLIDKVR